MRLIRPIRHHSWSTETFAAFGHAVIARDEKVSEIEDVVYQG